MFLLADHAWNLLWCICKWVNEMKKVVLCHVNALNPIFLFIHYTTPDMHTSFQNSWVYFESSNVLSTVLHSYRSISYGKETPRILSQYYTFIITCNRENQAKPCTRPSKLRSLCPLFIICYFSMHSYSLCIYVCVYMY